MPPLNAAVALKQVDSIAHLVGKDLNLNVAWALNESLQQNALVSKGCYCFSLS